MIEFKLFTAADVLKSLDDPEHKRLLNEVETAYRDGYYDAVNHVLYAIEDGITVRQIKTWHNSKVFDWRYRSNRDGFVLPPNLPDAWKIIRKRILEKYNYTCVYCGVRANHVDHVTPIAKGGTDDDDNLVAACRDCNLSKNAKTIDEWSGFSGFIFDKSGLTGE